MKRTILNVRTVIYVSTHVSIILFVLLRGESYSVQLKAMYMFQSCYCPTKSNVHVPVLSLYILFIYPYIYVITDTINVQCRQQEVTQNVEAYGLHKKGAFRNNEIRRFINHFN
jgi:hypothetical protein